MREGDRIDRYELVRRLGGGGFASIWLARDGIGDEVALKVLHPHHHTVARGHGPSAADRFLEEARILKGLAHPGVVRVLHVFDGRPTSVIGFAMEPLAGSDLNELAPTLSFREILEVMKRAAEILHDIHAQGVIHRDVKLSNIFVCAGADDPDALARAVRIIDFGVAKDFAEASMLAGTARGEFVGTLETMAPESFRRLEGERIELTPAVDQWGFGVAFYHALSGRLPFSAPHVLALIPQVLEDAPPPLRLDARFRIPDCPELLRRIVMRCLNKDPKARYVSAGALAGELGAFILSLDDESTYRGRSPSFGSLVAPSLPTNPSIPALPAFPGGATIPDGAGPESWASTMPDTPSNRMKAAFALPVVGVPQPRAGSFLDALPRPEPSLTWTDSGDTRLNFPSDDATLDSGEDNETTADSNDTAVERDEHPTARINVRAPSDVDQAVTPLVSAAVTQPDVPVDSSMRFGDEPTPLEMQRPSPISIRAVQVPRADSYARGVEAIAENAEIVARDPAATPFRGALLEGEPAAGPIRPAWSAPTPLVLEPSAGVSFDTGSFATHLPDLRGSEARRPVTLRPLAVQPVRPDSGSRLGKAEPPVDASRSRPDMVPQVPTSMIRPRRNSSPRVMPPPLPLGQRGVPAWLVAFLLAVGAGAAFWLGRIFG